MSISYASGTQRKLVCRWTIGLRVYLMTHPMSLQCPTSLANMCAIQLLQYDTSRQSMQAPILIWTVVQTIGKLCYIDRTSPDPRWVSGTSLRARAGRPLTPHRGSGVVLSMSYSFAIIIPLNYQINAKNNLSDQAENTGLYTFILPVVKTTCCYYQKYSTTADFGGFWCYFRVNS